MGERNEAGRNGVTSTEAPLTNQPSEEVDVAPAHSKRSPAFQFYPAEFLASRKVDRMSMTERGAYITLLCQCWLDNGLPTDLSELAESVRMKPAQFERMWENGKIRHCFVERGGKFHNERLDIERKKQIEYRRRQADNGSKGGRPTKSGGEAGNNPPVSENNPPVSDRKALISSHLVSTDLDSSRSPSVIRRRRLDAAFEHECGIYLPQRAHDDFAALHPGEDLFAWFMAVCEAWKGRNTGADMFRFWKARHDERWPPEIPVAAVRSNEPEWVRKVRERKAAQS